jgi:AcrR family transcriptional regulator
MTTVKDQITETFERHVADHGFQKANLDGVARELKISKKTIYVHFDGKRDIYETVVARQAQQMKMQLAASVALLPTHRARLEAVLRSMLETSRTHVVETSEEEWMAEYEVAADSWRKAYGDLMRELVQGGMEAGELPAGDAALVERMIEAMVIEYLMLVRADPAYDRDAELLERITRFVG